jgi:hypothetical protein
MKLRAFEIEMIADSGFRHGQGYAEGRIYRSTGRFAFRCPEALGLPDWVIQLDIETHKFLVSVYRHAFRAGLKQGVSSEK